MNLDKKKREPRVEILSYKTNHSANIYVLIVINWLSNVIMPQYLDTEEKLKLISVFRESMIILRIQEFWKL